MASRIEVVPTKDGQWAAHHVHGNNRLGSWTESYTRREDAWDAAKREWPQLFNEAGEYVADPTSEEQA